jgi:hypothetical protein
VNAVYAKKVGQIPLRSPVRPGNHPNVRTSPVVLVRIGVELHPDWCNSIGVLGATELA